MLGIDGGDLDARQGQPPLDVAHRRDRALALGLAPTRSLTTRCKRPTCCTIGSDIL
jgi:hypothetical protein